MSQLQKLFTDGPGVGFSNWLKAAIAAKSAGATHETLRFRNSAGMIMWTRDVGAGWRPVVLICLAIVGPSSADAERAAIKTFTTADGLARDSINRIVPDSRGFLWFCTTEGLSRFDGYTFRTYDTRDGLPHRNVTDLLETDDGQYWVATGRGVALFNPQSAVDAEAHEQAQRFRVYLPREVRSSSVTVLLEDSSGAVWVGTDSGLHELRRAATGWNLRSIDLSAPTVKSDNVSVRALLQDRRGALWISTEAGLYRRRPDGAVERYTMRDALPFDDIRALLEDREGRLWVGTTAGLGQLVQDPAPHRPIVVRTYAKKDGLPGNFVAALLQSSDGAIWAGGDGGLGVLTPASSGGHEVRSYSRAQGLSDRLGTRAGRGSGAQPLDWYRQRRRHENGAWGIHDLR